MAPEAVIRRAIEGKEVFGFVGRSIQFEGVGIRNQCVGSAVGDRPAAASGIDVNAPNRTNAAAVCRAASHTAGPDPKE